LDCYLRLLSRLYNATSSINAIIDTARTLGFIGFAFVANPVYGGFIAQPIPFAFSGIMHDSKRLSTLCCEKSCSLYADHISVP
jgi:hypothetical protein